KCFVTRVRAECRRHRWSKDMKRLVLGLMAAAALGIALPAAAHEESYPQQHGSSDWGSNADPRYGEFADDIAHIQEGIQHGVSDGSFDRWEVRRFSRELRNLQRMVWYYNQSGGFNSWERNMIQQRLDRLHETMHEAH